MLHLTVHNEAEGSLGFVPRRANASSRLLKERLRAVTA